MPIRKCTLKNSIYNKICGFKCKASTYDSCVFGIASIVSSIGEFDSNIDNRIQACNIIKNKQISNNYGIIYSESRLMINISCIVKNDASPLVYAGFSSIAILLNTIIDLPQSTTGFNNKYSIVDIYEYAKNVWNERMCCFVWTNRMSWNHFRLQEEIILQKHERKLQRKKNK